MDEIRELLAQPIEKYNGHLLHEQLIDIERQGAYVSQLHRAAEETLSEMRGKMYDPSGKTELQRKVDMDFRTREYKRKADEWADLAKLISDRISLGRTFLETMNGK